MVDGDGPSLGSTRGDMGKWISARLSEPWGSTSAAMGLRGFSSLLAATGRIENMEPVVRQRLPVAAVLARRTFEDAQSLRAASRAGIDDQSWVAVMTELMVDERSARGSEDRGVGASSSIGNALGFGIDGLAREMPAVDDMLKQLKEARATVSDRDVEMRTFARYVDELRGSSGAETSAVDHKHFRLRNDDGDDEAEGQAAEMAAGRPRGHETALPESASKRRRIDSAG